MKADLEPESSKDKPHSVNQKVTKRKRSSSSSWIDEEEKEKDGQIAGKSCSVNQNSGYKDDENQNKYSLRQYSLRKDSI